MPDIVTPLYTFFGESLDTAIETVSPERKPLIDNFLYEKSALMIYADDGVGKSVLTLQAMMQATHPDSKVFGEFDVPQGNEVLFFQMERHPNEMFERMRHLRKVVPFDKNKFAISVALQGINLQDNKSYINSMTKISEIVWEIGFQPSIMVFDPIYTMTASGLETAEACNAITSFFRVLQITFNCTIIATSHTNRGVRDLENPGKRVGQDMYGNRFLSAFFTGSYHLKGKSDGVGSVWTLDKNSQKNLEKKFELNYDPSNYCSMTQNEGKFSKKDKLNNFIRACKAQDKEFSYADMQASSGLSDSHLRGYLIGYLKEIIKETSKGKYGKLLYKAL